MINNTASTPKMHRGTITATLFHGWTDPPHSKPSRRQVENATHKAVPIQSRVLGQASTHGPYTLRDTYRLSLDKRLWPERDLNGARCGSQKNIAAALSTPN